MRKWSNKKLLLIKKRISRTSLSGGQGSVEVLVVTIVVMIIASALAVIGDAISGGLLLEEAMKNAPYNIGTDTGLFGYAILF